MQHAKEKRYLSVREREDYSRLCKLRNEGRLLTPDGIRFICRACDMDAEQIGRHFLDIFAKLESESGIMK